MPEQLQRFRQRGVEPTTGVTSGLPGSVVATPQQVRPSVNALQILDTLNRTAPLIQQQLEKASFEQGREDTLKAISGMPTLSTTEGQRKFAEMVQRGDKALGANPAVQRAVRQYGYQRMADLVMQDVRQRYYTSPYVGQSPDVVAQQAQGWIKERMDTLGLNPTDPGMIAFFNKDLEDKLQRQFLPIVGNDYVQQSGVQRREDMSNAVGNLTEAQLGVDFSNLSPEQSLAVQGDTAVGIQRQVESLVSQGETPLAAHQGAWESFSGGVSRYAQQAYAATSIEQVDQVIDSALNMLDSVPRMVSVDDNETWEDATWVRDGQQQLAARLERARMQNRERIQEEQSFAHKSRYSGGLMAINRAENPDAVRQALRAHTQSGQYTEDELEALQSYANTHITMLNKGLDKKTTGIGMARVNQLIATGKINDPDVFADAVSSANQDEAEKLWNNYGERSDEYKRRVVVDLQSGLQGLSERLSDVTTGILAGVAPADAKSVWRAAYEDYMIPVSTHGANAFDKLDAQGRPTMSEVERAEAYQAFRLRAVQHADEETRMWAEQGRQIRPDAERDLASPMAAGMMGQERQAAQIAAEEVGQEAEQREIEETLQELPQAVDNTMTALWDPNVPGSVDSTKRLVNSLRALQISDPMSDLSGVEPGNLMAELQTIFHGQPPINQEFNTRVARRLNPEQFIPSRVPTVDVDRLPNIKRLLENVEADTQLPLPELQEMVDKVLRRLGERKE